MKLQVRREDGQIEILTLTEPLLVHRCSCGQNSITTSTGITHFFTSEGAYSEFGLNLHEDIPMEYARAITLEYDRGRELLQEEEK